MRAADRQFDEAMVAQEVKGSRGEEAVQSNNCYIFCLVLVLGIASGGGEEEEEALAAEVYS